MFTMTNTEGVYYKLKTNEYYYGQFLFVIKPLGR